MAKKIFISGNSIVITDTSTIAIEFDIPKGYCYYVSSELATGTILLKAVGDIKSNFQTTYSVLLSDAEDESGTPFTATTFREFCNNNLGNPNSISTPSTTALMPYDYWYETRFLSTNNIQSFLFGTAVSSGTATTAVPVLSSNTLYPYGIFIRSATTANGGYRFSTSLLNTDFFREVAHKFQSVIMWKTSFTGRTLRIGYHDTTTSADATDGAYFEILENVVYCKTANNSTRTTSAMTTTLSLDTVYLFDIESNANGTLITYKLINAETNIEIESTTISSNIPDTSARGFGIGIVATESSTTASDICVIYYVGNGTLNAFNKQRG